MGGRRTSFRSVSTHPSVSVIDSSWGLWGFNRLQWTSPLKLQSFRYSWFDMFLEYSAARTPRMQLHGARLEEPVYWQRLTLRIQADVSIYPVIDRNRFIPSCIHVR